MNDIEWRDPPSAYSGRKAGDWANVLLPLMERPGQWAMVRRYENKASCQASAYALRNRRLKYPAGSWEFVARDGELFVRYLGPEES